MPISAPPPSWASIKNKPTTVSGFGITDMSSQTVANVTNITTAQVLAAEAGASAGGVGTYAFAHKSAGGSASNFGNTIAGSSLDVAGVGGIGGTLSGTWRCMGYAQDPNSSFLGAMTVWQRIS